MSFKNFTKRKILELQLTSKINDFLFTFFLFLLSLIPKNSHKKVLKRAYNALKKTVKKAYKALKKALKRAYNALKKPLKNSNKAVKTAFKKGL